MPPQSLSDFFGGYQRGLEVAVAGASADELLGVRQAFRRFFHDGLAKPVPVAVVPQESAAGLCGLAGSDREALEAARAAAAELARRLESEYQFFVGLDAGVESLELGGETRFLLRSWTVVIGPPGTAVGASAALELPSSLVDPRGPSVRGAAGTRRGGGLYSSVTGGLETRRGAVVAATVNALSTLFFGILDRRSGVAG
jgi:non-canonical (house-cleaning) NTP pyrophosphatase